MTNSFEQRPYTGQPDEFDLLVGPLHEQLVDPFVADVHKQARIAEQLLREEPTRENRGALQRHLDSEWSPYLGKPIELSGDAHVMSPEHNGQLMPRRLTGSIVESQGFAFYNFDGDGEAKIGHAFILHEDEKRLAGIMALDDLLQITLPEPSDQGRVQRFAYHYPDVAEHLHELVATSPRPDKIIKSLGEFTIDIDFRTQQGAERALDAQAYLRHITPIEPYANYVITAQGDVATLNEGWGTNRTIAKPTQYIGAVHSIELQPSDINQRVTESVIACAPYIRATFFFADRGDCPVLLPCRSIQDIRSVRYEPAP